MAGDEKPPLGQRFEIREVAMFCTYHVGDTEPVGVSRTREDAEKCRAALELNEWPWYSRPENFKANG